MNILFLHRNFPAQFRFIAQSLASDKNNEVVFITNNDKLELKGIQKLVYKTKREVPKDCHSYLRFYEDSIIHAQAAAEVALRLKSQGFKPDIIYGHTWGPTMFMKDIFPDVPLLCYFEWFYNAQDSDVDFNKKSLNENSKAQLRCKNSHLLVDLYTCDAGISPTNWQKNQFPATFHNKIKVIHDGVDTDFCKPDPSATFTVKEMNLSLSKKDEVITYATRGMEAYRGFPEFMKAVEKLLKERPNLHVVIAGEDRVCYGPKLIGSTYKQEALKNLDLDLNRIHFVGGLPLIEYVKLLQISKVHTYLTYPFVLSWSLLDALSTGCLVVASDTKPVTEVITNNENGLLVDFFDINALVSKITYALDNQHELETIRYNARKTILNNYALTDLLPKQIEYIKSLTRNMQTQINSSL